jgi:hypothetical protein
LSTEEADSDETAWRIVFHEEGSTPDQHMTVLAKGMIDDGQLEALEGFILRQRERIDARQKDENAAVIATDTTTMLP